MEKKVVAKELFLKGDTHSEIAQKLGISARTVADWSQRGAWGKNRAEVGMLEETRTEQILEIIDYQLSVLRAKVAEHKANKTEKLIDREEVAALISMYQTVKGNQQKLTDNIKLLRRVIEYANRETPKSVQDFVKVIDLIVTDLIKEA